MFLSAILLALIVGALLGGGLPRLAELKLRWWWLLGLALAIRIGATLLRQTDAGAGVPVGIGFIVVYVLILVWLGGNWRVPGLQIAAVGIGLNTLAVALNGGQMPIWSGAFTAAGFQPGDIANDAFHVLVPVTSLADFIASGGLFGDVIPIPLPVIRDVVSIGDGLLALGIFSAIVYSMTRPNAPLRASFLLGAAPMRAAAAAEFRTGLAYSGPMAGTMSGPAPFPSRPMPAATAAGVPGAVPAGVPAAIPAEPRVRPQSPYLKLARNRNFSLLWTGQLVSFMGDRVHQIALAFLVETRYGPLEVGLTFAATAVPNVLLGPLAGALVDRWDRRRTMIVSDLVRGGLVLLVPFVVDISVLLVYAIAFLVATVSLLFRPAKNALLPQIVKDDELVAANSATTVNETIADLIGYPIAGVVVAALSGILGAAFVLDSATYIVSAFLVLGMVVPREDLGAAPFRPRAIWAEMAEGWTFLRRQPELFSNTVVSSFAQIAIGTEIVCSLLYAAQVLDTSVIAHPQNYSLLMAAIGLGSVVGGVAIGAVAGKVPKGPMSIVGFISVGLLLIVIGFVTDPYVAIGLFFLSGVGNMIFLIPNITLFQERTPQRLMGRVVSTRQALVFGVMALSMGGAGWLSEIIGPAEVLMLGGAICAVAGLAGAFVPAMRNAR
jgi:MFS family permease